MNHQFPTDIQLLQPPSQLPADQQHFLLYIPWDDQCLQLVPTEFRDFFVSVLPNMRVRTTDVHTAVSLSYLDRLIGEFKQPINRRVVALALILHDTGWSRLTEQEIAASLGVKGLKLTAQAQDPKLKHAVESEKIARQLLAKWSFQPSLLPAELELICQAVRYHDQPEMVAGAAEPMPLEVQILVDLDHLWSFTHQNFWQDTRRKGVEPVVYLANLQRDLDSYFVTQAGKELANELWRERRAEVNSQE